MSDPSIICCLEIGISTLHLFFFYIFAISNHRLLTILHSQNKCKIVSFVSLQKLHSWVSFNLHLKQEGISTQNSMQYLVLKNSKLIVFCTIERNFVYQIPVHYFCIYFLFPSFLLFCW